MSFIDWWDNLKWFNKYIIGISVENSARSEWRNIGLKNSKLIKKRNLHIQEANKRQANTKQILPRNIIAKLQKSTTE